MNGALGDVLWTALNDVVTWGSAHPAQRAGLFPASAEPERVAGLLLADAPHELEDPLGTLATMVGRPCRARAERVVLACRQIASWADGQGRLATAFDFSLAAALVCPGDASVAWAVGRIARRRAEYATAETWLRRAVLLARQSGDWSSYALAFSGLGNMYKQRGNFPMARKQHLRTLRVARTHGLNGLQGEALHDLFAIAVESNQLTDAESYARGALNAYGSGHPRIPALAHDTAYFWMIKGHFARALRVFRSVVPHLQIPGERLVVLGNTARAAGGAEDVDEFRRIWEEVWELSLAVRSREGVAQALLDLALGATTLKSWDQAELAAQRALEISITRGEAKVRMTAEALIDSIRQRRLVSTRRAEEPGRQASEYSDELANAFVECLENNCAVAV